MSQEQIKEVAAREGSEESTVRIWYVYDKTRGDVESFHPSYAWASERLSRYAEFRPAGVDASIGECRAVLDGTGYQVLTTVWDSYRSMLLVAADGQEATVGHRLLRRAAMGVCRSQRLVRSDVKQVHAGRLPKSRPPAHELDIPQSLSVGHRDNAFRSLLSGGEALRAAAEENRQRLAEGIAWDGLWCVVVECGEILPASRTAPEFAGGLGIERLITHRVLRLVQPTEEEIAQFTSS